MSMKVLLVDDEEEFVKTMANRMKMRDVDVHTAADGEQALSRLKEDEPDVIVLDLKMPGMDGIEVLKQIKKAYPRIQVIMLTGHGNEGDRKQARKYGAFDYIEKPVNLQKLLSRIQAARQMLESTFAAAAFASAGEHNEARKLIEKDKDKAKAKADEPG